MPTKALPRKQAKVDTGHQCFSVLAQATAKIRPRPARCYFESKELHRRTKASSQILKWMLIERWRRPSMLSLMCQHAARLQFDSCAEKDSLCGTVIMAWIWRVWINAMVFVPTAKAPPKAGAKELSYNSLNLAYSGQHPCFQPNWFIQFCIVEMNTVGLEKLSHGTGKGRHWTTSILLWLRKQGARFSQG